MGYWIIATLAAFYVKGLCGFANTLVFQSILSFGVANINITPVELVLGYPSNMILAWKERKKIKWSLCLPVAALVVAGGLPGIFFLKNVNAQVVKIIFGVVIILVGFEMLFRDNHKKEAKGSKVLMALIGIVSGVLCGMYGIGVLLAAYMTRVTKDTSSFKANLSMVFIIENTMRITFYCIWGLITFDVVKMALTLIPFMLLGVFLGMQSSKILNEKIAKKVVIIMIIVSGAALLMTNL